MTFADLTSRLRVRLFWVVIAVQDRKAQESTFSAEKAGPSRMHARQESSGRGREQRPTRAPLCLWDADGLISVKEYSD